MSAVLEAEGLVKSYRRRRVVDGVSFRVAPGEVVGLLGPNGAGKTTTMRVLTGYMPPTDGKAVVAGYDVQDSPIEAKRRTTQYLHAGPVLVEPVLQTHE